MKLLALLLLLSRSTKKLIKKNNRSETPLKQPMVVTKKWLTATETAKRLNISRRTLYTWTLNGLHGLQYKEMGRLKRYSEESVMAVPPRKAN